MHQWSTDAPYASYVGCALRLSTVGPPCKTSSHCQFNSTRTRSAVISRRRICRPPALSFEGRQHCTIIWLQSAPILTGRFTRGVTVTSPCWRYATLQQCHSLDSRLLVKLFWVELYASRNTWSANNLCTQESSDPHRISVFVFITYTSNMTVRE